MTIFSILMPRILPYKRFTMSVHMFRAYMYRIHNLIKCQMFPELMAFLAKRHDELLVKLKATVCGGCSC